MFVVPCQIGTVGFGRHSGLSFKFLKTGCIKYTKIKIICQYNIVKRNILERKTAKTTKFEIFLTNHSSCQSLMKRTASQGVSMFKIFTL